MLSRVYADCGAALGSGRSASAEDRVLGRKRRGVCVLVASAQLLLLASDAVTAVVGESVGFRNSSRDAWTLLEAASPDAASRTVPTRHVAPVTVAARLLDADGQELHSLAAVPKRPESRVPIRRDQSVARASSLSLSLSLQRKRERERESNFLSLFIEGRIFSLSIQSLSRERFERPEKARPSPQRRRL